MHHTSIYTASIATAALTELTAQQDGPLSVQNGHLYPFRDLDLIAAYGYGTTLRRVRLQSPRNRGEAIPWINPIDQAATPADNPAVADYRRRPIRLKAAEELIVEAFQNAVGAEREFFSMLMRAPNPGGGMDFVPVPEGDMFTIRGTGTTTLTALTWSDVTITWDQTIAAGKWAIIGGQFFGATAHLFRLILDDVFYRPGGIAQLDQGGRPWEGQIKGGMGIWGYFHTVSYPRVQVYATAADTVEEIWLECVRVA